MNLATLVNKFGDDDDINDFFNESETVKPRKNKNVQSADSLQPNKKDKRFNITKQRKFKQLTKEI